MVKPPDAEEIPFVLLVGDESRLQVLVEFRSDEMLNTVLWNLGTR